MLRKIILCAALTAILLIAGCGSDKVDGSPDKAILAYAETVMTGDSPNAAAAGFGDEYAKSIRLAAVNGFIESMTSIVPLSDATAQQLTTIFFDKLKGAVTFKAKLKSDGDRPIVELTTTPIDYAGTAKAAVGNDDLMALLGMVGQLKADGATDEQLKANPEVQALAASAFGKYVENMTFQAEKTFAVPCDTVTVGGKTHWAPAEGKALIDFLTGQ